MSAEYLSGWMSGYFEEQHIWDYDLAAQRLLESLRDDGMVVVKLPEPNEVPAIEGNHEWPTEAIDRGAKVVLRASDGLIANDGIGSPYRSAEHARSHAEALLAAADFFAGVVS